MPKITFEYMHDGTTVTGDTYKTGALNFIYVSNKNEEVCYLTTIDIVGGTKATAVFNNENGEVLSEGFIYLVTITDLDGNIIVEEDTRIYSADNRLHEKTYGISGSGKQNIPVVAWRDVAILTATSGNTSNAYTYFYYPEGFNQNNCVILGVEHYNSKGYWERTYNSVDHVYMTEYIRISGGPRKTQHRIVLLRIDNNV